MREIRQRLCLSQVTLKRRALPQTEKYFKQLPRICLTHIEPPAPTTVTYHCQMRNGWRVFPWKGSLSDSITSTLTAFLAPVLHRNHIKKILFLSVAHGKTLPTTQSNLPSISQEQRHGVDLCSTGLPIKANLALFQDTDRRSALIFPIH